MQDALSDCLKEDLKGLCQEGLIDESTDISVTHNLILYVRIIHDEVVSTHFLELVELDEGVTVADKVVVVLEENGIGITEHKCIGFASDGAAVMTGKENGVAAILQSSSPAMIAVHCVAHRLALACSQAARGFPQLMQYKRTLIAIYSYFIHSSNRIHNMQEMQKVLEDRYKWLSFFNAIAAVKRTTKSLLAFFENEAITNEDPVARGLANFLS